MRHKTITLVTILFLVASAASHAQVTAEEFYKRGLFERFSNNDLDGAIADFKKAIELKPDYADAYNSRGIARVRKNDLDGAIADYSKAIQLSPGTLPYYSNRARARQEKGDLDGAISDFTKEIELSPEGPAGYKSRAGAYRLKNMIPAAVADEKMFKETMDKFLKKLGG